MGEKTPDETKKEAILSGLLYRVGRSTVENTEFEKSFLAKRTVGIEEFKALFEVSVDLPKEEIPKKGKRELKSTKSKGKKIFLPAWRIWEDLWQYYQESLKKLTLSEEYKGEEKSLKNHAFSLAVGSLKNDFKKKGDRLAHWERGDVLSLPVLPLGGVGQIRLKRKDHTGKRSFYQLQDIGEGVSRTQSFRYAEDEKGKVRLISLPLLRRNRNLSAFDPSVDHFTNARGQRHPSLLPKKTWVSLSLEDARENSFIKRLSVSNPEGRMHVLLRLSYPSPIWDNLNPFFIVKEGREEREFDHVEDLSREKIKEIIHLKGSEGNKGFFKALEETLDNSLWAEWGMEKLKTSLATDRYGFLKVHTVEKEFIDLEYLTAGDAPSFLAYLMQWAILSQEKGTLTPQVKVTTKEVCLL